MTVEKEVMVTINIGLVIAIFILNTLILIFRQDVSVLSLALGVNLAIILVNIIAIIVCRVGK